MLVGCFGLFKSQGRGPPLYLGYLFARGQDFESGRPTRLVCMDRSTLSYLDGLDRWGWAFLRTYGWLDAVFCWVAFSSTEHIAF